MTNEEKHAIIAEKIEGWKLVCIHDEGGRWLGPWLLSPAEIAKGGYFDYGEDMQLQTEYQSYRYRQVPNYSSSLDLVARAEAKVAGMERRVLYAYILNLQKEVGRAILDVESGFITENAFTVITAPATARVNALVSLAQMGVFDGK